MKKRYVIYCINEKGKGVTLVEDAYSMGECELRVLKRGDIKCVTNIGLLGHYIDGVLFKIDYLSKL